MSRRIVLDIESDDLYEKATTIWIISTLDLDTGVVHDCFPYRGDYDDPLSDVELVVTHNGIDFDLPLIEKLLGITYEGEHFDTYVASCLLNPDRKGGHSLKSWGQRLGYPKGDYNDWTKYSDEMLEYCHRDCEVTKKIYDKLSKVIYDKDV